MPVCLDFLLHHQATYRQLSYHEKNLNDDSLQPGADMQPKVAQ